MGFMARPRMSTPLLTVSGVSKRFGGLQALSEVELTIQPGQIHGFKPIQIVYIPDQWYKVFSFSRRRFRLMRVPSGTRCRGRRSAAPGTNR